MSDPSGSTRSKPRRGPFGGQRVLWVSGAALVAVWVSWWVDALVHSSLRGAALTWITVPAFGVDFWSQPDWAVRVWDLGTSPYVEEHMFHYPPVVIQLFRWVLLFDSGTALRIWIVVLAVLTGLAVWTAWRLRRRLGLARAPLPFVLGLVLFSYPVIFALERSNFDLITLAAILAAMAATRLPRRTGGPVAGAILSLGPWVKIYPGLLGVALVALRWWRALAGFVVGGVVIGLLEPSETLKSFHLIRKLIAHHSRLEAAAADVFLPWSHSLSMLVRKALAASSLPAGAADAVPASLGALVLLAPAIVWVALRIYRCRAPDVLAFPALCWVVAAGSFVPEVANDYSLVFLPVAAVAVWSFRDPWPLQVAFAFGLLAMQPIALPVSGFILLATKVTMLVAVGGSIVGRAAELDAAVESDCRKRPRLPSHPLRQGG